MMSTGSLEDVLLRSGASKLKKSKDPKAANLDEVKQAGLALTKSQYEDKR